MIFCCLFKKGFYKSYVKPSRYREVRERLSWHRVVTYRRYLLASSGAGDSVALPTSGGLVIRMLCIQVAKTAPFLEASHVKLNSLNLSIYLHYLRVSLDCVGITTQLLS